MKSRDTELLILGETEDERTSEILGVLNRWPNEPALKRLAMILGLTKRAEELQLEPRMDDKTPMYLALARHPGLRRSSTIDLELDRVLEELNKFLGRYRVSLALQPNANGSLDRRLMAGGARKLWEAAAVLWITDLARNRTLSRLRRCRQCTKWFYAARSHQFSCSESCRKKSGSATEDFKRKRREYMASYRAGLKRHEESGIAIVRPERKRKR